MIKKNRNKSLEKLREASKVPLEHMFNNHDNFREELLFKTRTSVEVKEHNEK